MIRGKPRPWGRSIPKLLLLSSSILISHCGADPSFVTKDKGESDSDSSSNADSTAAGQSGYKEVKTGTTTAELCQMLEVSDDECRRNYTFMKFFATQGIPGGVDILWVIDNSGSMREEQQYLGDNFNSFITQLTESNADFQVAITSTDVCHDSLPNDLAQRRCPTTHGTNHHRGDFIGVSGAKVLAKGNPNIISMFKEYVDIGISGSGYEHGLTAAYLGIEKSRNGTNESLIRDDSYLAVIVVSDEEDDGIGLSQTDSYTHKNYWDLGMTRYKYTADNFIDYLHSVKSEGQFSISTITGTKNEATGQPCSSPHSKPREIGTQYISAADKTGGIVQSICEENWDSALAEIGKDLNAQITKIKLDKPAVSPAIKVWVDGEQVSNWTYVEATSSIKFSPDHIPENGAIIFVEYLTSN